MTSEHQLRDAIAEECWALFMRMPSANPGDYAFHAFHAVRAHLVAHPEAISELGWERCEASGSLAVGEALLIGVERVPVFRPPVGEET